MLRTFFIAGGVMAIFLCGLDNFLGNGNDQQIEPTKDWFYYPYYKGDPNLPLVRPYHIEFIPTDNEWWMMNTYTDKILGAIGPVRQIDVKGGIIFLYCTSGSIDVSLYPLYSNSAQQAWLIIQSDKRDIIAFINEDQFTAYLVNEGIESPEWKDIQGTWETFNSTGDLPWK